MRLKALAAAIGLLAGGFAMPGVAEASQISLELNKLEPVSGACRAYLVLANGTGDRLVSLKLDLVMFDNDGIVSQRLAVEVAPLPAGKTSLKVFDIAGLACDRISRILLNDVRACEDGNGARTDCLEAVSTSSRGTVPFIK
jgi:hypothetical protein